MEFSSRRLGPALDFMRVIWALDHALQRTSKRLEKSLGVTAPQRLVIRILGRFPGMQAGELAAVLHLHPSTLTGVLERLRHRRFITRRADPRDRRRALLGLTARGKALDVDAEGTVESAVREALQETSGAKIENAAEVLVGLTKALDSRRERETHALARRNSR